MMSLTAWSCSGVRLVVSITFRKLGESSNLQNVIDATNLTTEQLLLIKGMIAQFEQSNPAKAENKSLTYSTENVGGGGGIKQPEPIQQAQSQDKRILLDSYSQEICAICE